MRASLKKDGSMDKSMGDDSTPEQSPVGANGGFGTTARKRKRQDPSELCQQLYDSIRNVKKDDGSMLCDTFIRAPKRRQEPSYYEVVTNPIDLLRVQQKLKTESYDDIDDLSTDIELLVKNAKAFYKPGSDEHADACLLWSTFNANRTKMLDAHADAGCSTGTGGGDDERRPKRIGRPRKSASTADGDDAASETSSNKAEDDAELYEELFATVMTATDDAGRSLNPMFLLLPSKKLYSDYYDIIDHPIDLKFIATKIQTSAYASLNEMEKDLMQMTKNACTFNEPGSQIYKDAKSLRRIIAARKVELDSGKWKTAITKPKRRGQSLSAQTSSLREPVEESDDENDEQAMDTDQGDDGPLWQLFDQLYNSANSSAENPNATTGAPLGESLWKLPNRRFNPEYYAQIKKPISMSQIRKKLKKGDYVNIFDLTADLYQMLDNAKKAFPGTHKVYKDALKMQKLLNQKLIDVDQDDDDDDDEDEDGANDDDEDDDDEDDDAIDEDDSDLEDDLPLAGATPLNSKTKRKPRTLIGGALLTSPQQTGMASSMSSNAGLQTPNSLQHSQSLHHNAMSNAAAALNSPKARFPNNPVLKKKLLGLQRFLCDYTVAGRRPMTLFMEKPSKKLYPDYYEVIQHPIDMLTIEQNIKNDRYGTLDDVVGDFRLMFLNCRKYNEENSTIFEDSNILERALNEKLKEFSGFNDRRLTPKVINHRRKNLTPMDNKLKLLYEAIRDFREPKANRQLALIFMKLPSKNDYPDYYDIIKNPIDMEKIAHKLKTQFYDNVDEIAADFMLMFENACKYNEPDSQLYKDALVLQQVCIQTKQALRDGDDTVPDVPQAVQELLLFLFTAVYNHQDEEGRCFSDSLAELPEHDDAVTTAGETSAAAVAAAVDSIVGADEKKPTISVTKVRAISLDLIKRRLDKVLYKRLDTFQDDVFLCLERARRLSRTDSQIFEDAVELQAFFIRKRDEVCRDTLSSPAAFAYTAMHLSSAVESDRQAKLIKEEHEQHEQQQDQQHDVTGAEPGGESMTLDQKVYSPGDFVYYTVAESRVPAIIYIERLYTDASTSVRMMFGNPFIRPCETYHVTTRKFLEQELFKGEQHVAVPLAQVLGKCHVMSAKDYFKLRPDGFADKDVYVCESRYFQRLRSFKKIKMWPFQPSSGVKLVLRAEPLEPRRVMSVFKDRVDKHKGELAELQEQEALQEKEKPNVVVQVNNGEPGHTYYEQYNTMCSGVVKLGDYVYVATETGKQTIAQVHSMWETPCNKTYFRGPWLLTPPEIPGTGNRFFYRQELMLSTLQETNPIVAIVGRCAVLEMPDYANTRPTEIPESDVFVCESIYDEHKKQLRRSQQGAGLRKFQHSSRVTADELYHFKRSIVPVKVSANEIAALQDSKGIGAGGGGSSSGGSTEIIDGPEMLGFTEDSLDGGPPSVGSADMQACQSSPAPATTPATAAAHSRPRKGEGRKSRLVTGYILYSSEVRKDRAQNNPDCSFGDISRMVGNEWRSLPLAEKQAWEERAKRYNEETAATHAEEMLLLSGGGSHCSSPAPQSSSVTPAAALQGMLAADPVPNQVFDCAWNGCDWQFEDPADCVEHIFADETGHIRSYFAGMGEVTEYNCAWRNCIRFKKNAPAFPHMARLLKHVREVHVSKSGRIVLPAERSKNYMPSKKKAAAAAAAAVAAAAATAYPNQSQQFMQQQQQLQVQIQHQQQQQMQQQQQQMQPTYIVAAAPPAEPLFVTVPPRPQRVLHSEAYIKYIEGLQNGSRYITPWDKTLNARRESAPVVDVAKLPTQWLRPEVLAQRPDDAVTALWKLRDYMMKDVLDFSRY